MTDSQSIRPTPRPIVALVGRPNVGKSTLFNRLVGQRKAIVEDLAGTTRDRLYGDAEWNGRTFMLVDTGGLDLDADDLTRATPEAVSGFEAGSSSRLFLREIRAQVEIAIDEAEVIVFVVDADSGLTASDEDIAGWLRRVDKPVLLAVNKADNKPRRDEVFEFYSLGLSDPIAVSAMHGTGTGDLLDAIVSALPEAAETEVEDTAVHVAILGRPNVGKSSLLNKLLGEERVIVSEVPGTTRDAIDTRLIHEGEEMVLIDTAGIRRRGKIKPGVEKHSFLRAIKAIDRSDVCLLLVDAGELMATQDAHIASYIIEAAKSVVVLVNKWDLIEDKDTNTINTYTDTIRTALKFLDYVPVLFISAKTGQRVSKVLALARQVYAERLRRISTSDLNRLLREAVEANPPKGAHRHRLKFLYLTQAETNPPTFIFFVNDASLVHFTYKRYLENRLRAQYGFLGTPLRLVFRNRDEERLTL